MEEITINDLIEEYCLECSKIYKCNIKYQCDAKQIVRKILTSCKITRKTNREQADGLFQKGIYALSKDSRGEAFGCFYEACKLYQKG